MRRKTASLIVGGFDEDQVHYDKLRYDSSGVIKIGGFLDPIDGFDGRITCYGILLMPISCHFRVCKALLVLSDLYRSKRHCKSIVKSVGFLITFTVTSIRLYYQLTSFAMTCLVVITHALHEDCIVFSVYLLSLFVCLSVCQHDNSRSVRDIITQFSGHYPMVELERVETLENGWGCARVI